MKSAFSWSSNKLLEGSLNKKNQKQKSTELIPYITSHYGFGKLGLQFISSTSTITIKTTATTTIIIIIIIIIVIIIIIIKKAEKQQI